MGGKPAVRSTPRHVSVIAVADATVSTLFGIYDVMSVFERVDPPGGVVVTLHVGVSSTPSVPSNASSVAAAS